MESQLSPSSAAVRKGGVLRGLGWSAATIGAVASMIVIAVLNSSDSVCTTLLLCGLLLGGIALLSLGYARLSNIPRLRKFDTEAYEQRNHEEHQALQEWREDLTDRPTNEEMAEWLDYDVRAAKLDAIERFGISHQEVIASCVLFEPHTAARAARIPDGAMRYSMYLLRLFLLTDNGVRSYRTILDVYDGAFIQQFTEVFRYEVIRWAAIREDSVRYGEAGRTFIDQQGTAWQGRPNIVTGTYFRLHVDGGHDVEALIADAIAPNAIDSNIETREDVYQLAKLASGVNETLRLLEAIAADGKDWIARERERHLDHLQDFEWRQRKALPPHPRDAEAAGDRTGEEADDSDATLPSDSEAP